MGETCCEVVAKVGAKAPEFAGQAVMPDGSFKEVKLSDYKGKNVVLFFYPLDFTFVCPTEIIAFSEKCEEFAKKNTQLIGVSVDSHFSHFAWRNTPQDQGGIGDIKYPLVSDLSKCITASYGILADALPVALRGLFLIDKEGTLQHSTINNLPLGRNVDEALRMVDALTYFEENGEVCPANWKAGEEGMKPNQEGLKDYAGSHYKK